MSQRLMLDTIHVGKISPEKKELKTATSKVIYHSKIILNFQSEIVLEQYYWHYFCDVFFMQTIQYDYVSAFSNSAGYCDLRLCFASLQPLVM